jgi:hypothetical protein
MLNALFFDYGVESNKLLAQVFLEQSIIFQLAEEFYVVMKPYAS